MFLSYQKAIDYLTKTVKTDRLSHAYLFIGKQKEIENAAFYLAKLLMPGAPDFEKKFHPDIIKIFPETVENTDKKETIKKEKEITILQIRNLCHQLSFSPYQFSFKIAIIFEAQKISSEAASALLKVLEEPTKNTILILLAKNLSGILPTVISRTQLIKFQSVPDFTIPPDCMKDLTTLLNSNLFFRFQYVNKLAKDISQIKITLNYWLIFFRNLLLKTAGYKEDFKNQPDYSLKNLKNIVESILETQRQIENPSINAKLILEALVLKF